MNIMTVSKKRYMTYEFYIKEPLQTIEIKLIMKNHQKPHLISSLDRSPNHVLYRNYS